MVSGKLSSLTPAIRWTCRSCQRRSREYGNEKILQFQKHATRAFTSSSTQHAQLEVQAAPEIDFEQQSRRRVDDQPARIIPVSASYFTTTPVLNDHQLRLEGFLKSHGALPTVRPEDAPRISWMSLEQLRSMTGEKVGALKHSQILILLRRLNLIHPRYKAEHIRSYLELFRKPGSVPAPAPKPSYIDEFGRSAGVGRRKSSVAKVVLVEGTGEVLVNGQNIVDHFPRIHDRESALWPLKITNRIDKYNVFVMTHGGGLTGQAESVTLAVAKALIVQEPALKPALRKGEPPHIL
jgi:small subunit ribosomal protein S9